MDDATASEHDRAARERERHRIYREANREKIAERQRAYRQRNRERIAERERRYAEENRETRREIDRRYKRRHAEAIRERKRAYRQANPDKTAETWRRWAAENPDRAAASGRRWRAALASAVSEPYTRAEVWAKSQGRCGICELRILQSQGVWHVDHIVPLSRGGDDTLANIQAAHARCNIAKGNRVH